MPKVKLILSKEQAEKIKDHKAEQLFYELIEQMSKEADKKIGIKRMTEKYIEQKLREYVKLFRRQGI